MGSETKKPFSVKIGTLPDMPEYMAQDWAVDRRINNIFPNPYPTKIIILAALRRITGASKRHSDLTKYIPKSTTLNNIEQKYKIGFVGDIMPMFFYELEFDQSIIDFFSDVDLIVANLEGIISVQPKYVFAQRHHEEIMDQLLTIQATPKKWLLNLCNNHSGDLGFAQYIFMLNRLHWKGFKIMGRRDIPNYPYKHEINFVSGTQWSNQSGCGYIVKYDEIDDHFDDKKYKMNILSPHWNYEMEMFPRQFMVNEAKEKLKKWDLIFGHHPHTPQPITSYSYPIEPKSPDKGTINKLVGYSGGDFTSGLNIKAHNYGTIMKCDIGPLVERPEQFAIGDVKWEFLRTKNPRGVNLSRKINAKFHKKDGLLKMENPPLRIVKVVEKCPLYGRKKIFEE